MRSGNPPFFLRLYLDPFKRNLTLCIRFFPAMYLFKKSMFFKSHPKNPKISQIPKFQKILKSTVILKILG